MPYIIDAEMEARIYALAEEQGRVSARESLVSVREDAVADREKDVIEKEKRCFELLDDLVARENNLKETVKANKDLKIKIEKERKELNEFKLSLDAWHKKLCGDAEKINSELCLLRKERAENDRIVRDMCEQQGILNYKIEMLDGLIKSNKDSEDGLDKKIVEFKIAEERLKEETQRIEEEKLQLVERRKGLDAKEGNLNDYKRILDIKEGELKAKELENEKMGI